MATLRRMSQRDEQALLRDYYRWLAGFRARETADGYLVRCERVARLVRRRSTSLAGASTQELEWAMRHSPPSPSTQNHYRQALNRFFQFLIERRIRRDNPAGFRLLASRRGLPRPVSRLHRTLYLSAAERLGARSSVLAHLGVYGGLRIGEALRLPWSSITDSRVLILGKGSRERVLPVVPALRSALNAWHQEAPVGRWVFPGLFPDRHLTVIHAERLHRAICEEAGVEPFTYHRLRHTFATELLRASEGDLLLVRDALGHSSVRTTEVYAAVDAGRLAPAMGRMYPDAV